ncbi:MAG TPA: hypothetical protein PLV45_16895 [bacterium]|nr:hypothetical protein [bacterium]
MNTTSDRSQLYTGPIKSILITASVVFLLSLPTLPAPARPGIIFAWAGAAGAGAIFRSIWCIPSAAIGFCLARFLVPASQGILLSPYQTYSLIILTAAAIGISTWLALKIRTVGFAGLAILLFLCAAGSGFLLLQMASRRIGFIYFSAQIIVSILALSKTRSMPLTLPTLFISWLTGYLVWMTAIFAVGLDPSGYLGISDFLAAYFLIPFAAYLLQIIICAHIVHAVHPAQNPGNTETA